MSKLLDKIINLFKGNKKKAATPPQTRPKVKRQNAVPTLSAIENKAQKEMPKKQAVDKKVSEAKKKHGDVKTGADTDKAKKKKYYRYKHKKLPTAPGKEGSGNKGK